MKTLKEAIKDYAASYPSEYGNVYILHKLKSIHVGFYTSGTAWIYNDVGEKIDEDILDTMSFSLIKEFKISGEKNIYYTIEKENEPMNNIDRHVDLCQELHDFYKRHYAYNDSFHQSYSRWGATMSAIQLEENCDRLREAIKGGDMIRNILMDIANIALMTVVELDSEDKR